MFIKSKTSAVAMAAALLALTSTGAMAAVDITELTAAVADAKTAVLAIGAAVFGVIVAIKLYKWVRRGL